VFDKLERGFRKDIDLWLCKNYKWEKWQGVCEELDRVCEMKMKMMYEGREK
jgi:hypothetical protein